jgi:hypothetical protein
MLGNASISALVISSLVDFLCRGLLLVPAQLEDGAAGLMDCDRVHWVESIFYLYWNVEREEDSRVPNKK